jgi:transcription elongation GreA/GreB family factor
VIEIKHKLYSLCREYISQRIETAQQAINAAQNSANEETKSSAGDKYETGRAMMQLEIEKNGVQLAESLKLKHALDQINIERRSEKIQSGSLVITDHDQFFISISAGKFSIDNKTYLAIAPTSPIGMKLIGLRAGDTFAFNAKTYKLLEIW